MIHELRVYTIIQGREDVELIRFEKHLPALFKRHGIRLAGCWTAHVGPAGPNFVYAMAYDNLAERETQWAAFYADPDWHRIRAETQGDEECVDRFDTHFLRANAAWQLSAGVGEYERIGGVHDLVFAEVAVGKNAMANEFLKHAYQPAIARAGGAVMLLSDFITGPRLPKIALLIAWPDAAARSEGWAALTSDADLHAARAAERQAIGRPSIGLTESWMLEPTPFSLPLRQMGFFQTKGDV